MKTSNTWKMDIRARQIVKNVAICLAAFMGLIALYYCLLPALAENASETDVYVFFDNGLSQYEGKTDPTTNVTTVVKGTVYSTSSNSAAGTDLEMKLLSQVIADNSTLWSAVKAQLGDAVQADGTITNMNPANVYVSTSTVQVGKYVSFTAWDSGTVYDTVVNYRINSASREWGYDYVDFQWTSPKTALAYGNNCYYAPPQLMIYRYAAVAAMYSGGPKALRQMIYQHGDSYNTTEIHDVDGDGVNDIDISYDSSSKPETTGSWVNPQNAYGRTFYDAVLDMEGVFGKPTDVNTLAVTSQSANGTTLEGSVVLNGDGDNGLSSANKKYHATATFFDYFSDWELAGNPLSDHVTSYTYDSEDGAAKQEIWSMDMAVTGGVYTITENFADVNQTTITNIASGDNIYVRNNTSNGTKDSHTPDDNSYFLQFAGGTAEYKLPTDATGDVFESSVWVRAATSNNTSSITVNLYYEFNGVAHTIPLNDFSHYEWSDWTLLETGLFNVPDGATNCALRYVAKNSVRLDDFTLKYESSSPIPDGGSASSTYTTIADANFDSGEPKNYNFSSLDLPHTTTDDSSDFRITNQVLYNLWHRPVVYTMPSDLIKAGTYRVSIKITDTQFELRNAAIWVSTDGGNSGSKVTAISIGKESNTAQTNVWHTMEGTFTVSEGVTDVRLYFQTFDAWYTDWAESMHTDSAYYDNFKLEYLETAESTSVQEAEITLTHGENSSGQSDYASKMDITLNSADNVKNNVGMQLFLNIADSDGDGITAGGYPIPQGQFAYSNKESYLIEGTAFATGAFRLRAEHYYQYYEGSVSESNRKMEYVGEEILAEYSAGGVQISEHFAPPVGANATKLYLEAVDSGAEIIISHVDISKALINLNGTFSEGTNRISYSYQGMGFNEAISQYYVAAGADASKITPLYFGSNSWMTGNLRYYSLDPDGQKLFTNDEIVKALSSVGRETSSDLVRNDFVNLYYGDGSTNAEGAEGDMIHPDGKNEGSAAAYLIPLSREYWINLFGYGLTTAGDTSGVTLNNGTLSYSRNPNWQIDDEPLGGSNSRGVENLVIYNEALDNLVLNDGTETSTLVAPYFNTAFLEGDNEANAVYGDVYDNVEFAFAYNEDSKYYEFDSTKAYYAVRLTQNGTTGRYYMDYYNYSQLVDHYDGETTGDVVTYKNDNTYAYPGVAKADGKWSDSNGSSQTLYQFLPFNSPATSDRFATENLMFGMKLDIPFNMAKELTYNGVPVDDKTVADLTLKETKVSNSMFKFSGDDDVWVYVDGQKVLDIGGTHTAVGGFIDLKNGYGVLGSTYADYTGMWKDSSNLAITNPALDSGKDQGIQNLEKAAFAALASLEEIDILHDTAAALTNGNATEWVSNETNATVEFFDDVYTFKVSGGAYFKYRIRRTTSGEYVIDVNVPAAVNNDKIAAGTVTFDLFLFVLESSDDNMSSTVITDETEQTTTEYQIIDHELTIYYMERGLNSSNFKLAFNFVDNADREVEKSWGDGAVPHSNDAILVALYGADPGSDEGTFNLGDTDYSLVRLIAHNSLVNDDTENTGDKIASNLTDNDGKVSVKFQLNDENINSAAAVSINGMPITEEVYQQLYSTMGLRIYIDYGDGNGETEVQIDNNDGTVSNYEFFNPATAYSASGFQIQYCTDDWGKGNVTDAQKRSAIKVRDAVAGNGCWIRIEFDQVNCANWEPTPEAGANGWGFFDTSAWLIEVFGWDVDNNKAVPVISRKFDETRMTLYKTDDAGYYPVTIPGTTKVRQLDPTKMEIVITNVLRERNNEKTYQETGAKLSYVQACNVTATAVVPGDKLALQYTNSRTRKFMLGTGAWTNIFQFDKANYNIDTKYDGDGTEFGFSNGVDVLTLSETDTANIDRALMVVVGGASSLNQDLGREENFSYENTYKVEGFGYNTTEPKLYGGGDFDWDIDGDGVNDPGVYKLDDESDWKALWEGLPSAEVINNASYQYKYFIREIAILEEVSEGNYVEKKDTSYRTTYYADSVAPGNEIAPVYFTINGESVGLYSLDTDQGRIVISNEEITDATITKSWTGVSQDEQVEVNVNVYVEDPANPGVITLYDTVTINAATNWSATLEDLLVYNNNQNNPQKLIYYAAEQELEKFAATYNGTRYLKNYGGSEIAVYQLNTVRTLDPTTNVEKETYGLTVTNQSDGFVLEVDKFDEDGTTPLEGATFVLYEWTGEGDPTAYLKEHRNELKELDADDVWSADEILANVGFGLWMPVSDGETTQTEAVTPQSEDETPSEEDTASADIPKSVKVMNKVVETATATVANVNSTTTYTTTKKVGSIAADITSAQAYNFSSIAGNDYFTIEGNQTDSYGGGRYPYLDSDITFNGVTFANGAKGLQLNGNTSPSVTFSTSGACTVELVITHRVLSYKNDDPAQPQYGPGDVKITTTLNGTTSTTTGHVDNSNGCVLTMELKSGGTHVLTRSNGQHLLLYIKVTPKTTTPEEPEEEAPATTSLSAQTDIQSDASLVFTGNPGSENYVYVTEFVYYQAEGTSLSSKEGNTTTATKPLNFGDSHSVNINGSTTTTTTKGLKMQGGTRIGFTLGITGTLKVYVYSKNTTESGVVVTPIGGTPVTKTFTGGSSNVQELTFELTELGEYSIARSGSEFFIEAVYFQADVEILPFRNATDAEMLMNLLNKNELKYTADKSEQATYIDPETWYESELAHEVARKIISYQVTEAYAGIGGWTKEDEGANEGKPIAAGYSDWGQATIDNDITTAQILFLAKMFTINGNHEYKTSAEAGIRFILGPAYVGEYYLKDGTYGNPDEIDTGLRYANGGFAQRFDENSTAYHRQITLNDDAMVNVLELLMKIGNGDGDFSFLYGSELAEQAIDAVHAGVECLLNMQLIVNSDQDITGYYDYANGVYCGGDGDNSEWKGKYVAWCQQYDPDTLKPGWGRNYEPPAISARESVGAIVFLRDYYNSSLSAERTDLRAKIPRRVNAAVDWIISVQIGLKVDDEHANCNNCAETDGNCNWAVETSEPSWARYYSLTDGKTPIWADREFGNIVEQNYKYSYNAMSCERRNGYSYIGTWPSEIALNPDDYRIPIDGTVVKDLIVHPSMPLNNESCAIGDLTTGYGWYDYGDAWSIVSGIKNWEAVYGDVNYSFSDLPTALIGAEYIRPANDSSVQNAASALATFRLSKTANVFIPIPDNITPPAWLAADGWKVSTVKIKVNNQSMTLYSKTLAANADSESEPYSLYSLAAEDASILNYGVFIVVGSSEATKYTTDANGEVSISGLKGDTYYAIIEISAPLGYMPLEKPTLFSVFTVSDDEDENFGLIDTNQPPVVDDHETGFVKMQWDKDKAYVVDADILNDSTHVDLPNTGGSLLSIIFNGMSIIIPVLAGAYFLWKRREDPVE